MDTEHDAAAVIAFARDQLQAEEFNLTPPDHPNNSGTVPLLVAPLGKQILSVKKFFDEYRDAPERRTGTATHTELDSFITHVNRFKDGDSAVFAKEDPKDARLCAVLDYHRAGSEGAPRFGQHRSLYQFPVSDEWKTWAAVNGQKLEQAEFAEFIEEHIADVAEPAAALDSIKTFTAQLGVQLASPAKLMELSRGLSVNVSQKVVNSQNLSTGEAAFIFEERHVGEGSTTLKVPGAIMLQIPVFRGGARYQVPVRLRYRIQGGAVAWTFALYRTDLTFQHAFDEACATVVEKTSLPLYRGTPE